MAKHKQRKKALLSAGAFGPGFRGGLRPQKPVIKKKPKKSRGGKPQPTKAVDKEVRKATHENHLDRIEALLMLTVPTSTIGTGVVATIKGTTAASAFKSLVGAGRLATATALLERRSAATVDGAPLEAVVKAFEALPQNPPPTVDAAIAAATAAARSAEDGYTLTGASSETWLRSQLCLVIIEWLAESQQAHERRERLGVASLIGSGHAVPGVLRFVAVASKAKLSQLEIQCAAGCRFGARAGDALGIVLNVAADGSQAVPSAHEAEMVEVEFVSLWNGLLTVKCSSAAEAAVVQRRAGGGHCLVHVLATRINYTRQLAAVANVAAASRLYQQGGGRSSDGSHLAAIVTARSDGRTPAQTRELCLTPWDGLAQPLDPARQLGSSMGQSSPEDDYDEAGDDNEGEEGDEEEEQEGEDDEDDDEEGVDGGGAEVEVDGLTRYYMGEGPPPPPRSAFEQLEQLEQIGLSLALERDEPPSAEQFISLVPTHSAAAAHPEQRGLGLARAGRPQRAPEPLDPHLEMVVSNLTRTLNESQRVAIRAATTERRSLTLIQGPPGTGKTRVALTILEAWLHGRVFPHGTMLAASDSNIAVDNLLEGLVRRNVRVVRLGRIDAVREDLRRFCPARDGLTPEQQSKELKRLVANAQVVCCTTMSLGSGVVKQAVKSCLGVLVDEATQATEASTLVALTRGARQLVMLGDQCQLPPTTLSTVPPGTTLDASLPLFMRLLHDGVVPLLLDTQYRMHPAISQLPSDLFYAGRLADGTPAEDRPALEGFPWPHPGMPVAMVALDVGGGASGETSRGTSFVNLAECDAAVQVVSLLLGPTHTRTTRPEMIGIISPYAAQCQELKRRPELRGIEVSARPSTRVPLPNALLPQLSTRRVERSHAGELDRRLPRARDGAHHRDMRAHARVRLPRRRAARQRRPHARQAGAHRHRLAVASGPR